MAPILRAEGAKATLFTRDPHARDVLRGYVPRQTVADLPKGAVVLFDDVGHGRLGSLFRGRGHPVIGGNALDAELELDREHGARVAERYGIEVPETHGFDALRAGRRFLEREGGDWFIKPVGDHKASCASTENGDAEHLLRFLGWVERSCPEDYRRFILQRKVNGLEIDCDGWFNGEQFVEPFFSTLEDKKLMDGDRGPRTGCACNAVWPWPPDALLPTRSVALIEDVLRNAKYVGNIAMNMILTDDGTPHFLEWSARTGFDALQALVPLLDTEHYPLHQQLDWLARGELIAWYLRPDVSLSLTTRVSVPPYPNADEKGLREIREWPLDDRWDGSHPRLYPTDVMRGPDGRPCVSGLSGSIGTVGATGTDMAAIRERVHELATEVAPKRGQWRSDLVPRYESAMATLRDLGYGAPPEEEVADAHRTDQARAAG